jgi:diguanylate cyclase (GGDEF)-like protein
MVTALAWFNGKQYDKAKYYSEKDPLTNAYNRRYGERKFVSMKEKLNRSKEKLAIYVIDINEFKKINDTFGHPFGDEILKKVTHQISASLGEKDLLCRWGGDEFIILSPHGKSSEEVHQTINRIEKSIKRISIKEFNLSISLGTSIYPTEADTLHNLIKLADQKMYHQKLRMIDTNNSSTKYSKIIR